MSWAYRRPPFIRQHRKQLLTPTTIWRKNVNLGASVNAVASNTATLSVTAETTVQVTEDGRLVFSGAVVEGGDIPISRIRQVGTTQTGSAADGADVTLTFDGDPQEGDVVVVFGGISSAGPTLQYGPETAGYTEQAYHEEFTTLLLQVGVWTKVLGATPDTDVVCNGRTTGQDAAAYMSYVLRGVDTSTPLDVAIVEADEGTTTTPDPDAVTTVTDKAFVFAFAAWNTANDATGYPAGYTGTATVNGNDIRDIGIGAAFKKTSDAGAENPGTFTIPSSEAYAFTVAVRPAVNAFVTEDGAIIFPSVEISEEAPGTTDLTGTINGVGDHDFGSKQLQRSASAVESVADHNVASKQVHKPAGTIPAVGEADAGSHQTHKPAGTIPAVGSATANLKQTQRTSGTIPAVGDIDAGSKQLHRSSATVEAVGSVAGTLKEIETLDSTVTAVGSVAADSKQLHRSSATVASVADHDYASKQVHKPAATVEAVASNTAQITVGADTNLTGTVVGVADHDYASKQLHRSSATVASVADHDAASQQVHKPSGTITGVGSAAGDLKELERPAGTVTGVGDINAASHQAHKPAGTIPAVGDVDVGSKQLHRPSAEIQAVGSNTAQLTVGAPANLTGTVTGVADHNYASEQIHKPAGTIQAVGTVAGDSHQVHTLDATVASVAESDAASKQAHKPAGTVTAVGSNTAALTQTHKPAGELQAVASNTAAVSIGQTANLTAAVTGVGSNTAALELFINLAASGTSVVTVTGTPLQLQPVTAALHAVAQISGVLSQIQFFVPPTLGVNGVSDALAEDSLLSDLLVGAVSMSDAALGVMGVDDA